MTGNQRRIIWGGLLGVSFIISLGLYLLAPSQLVPTVLFFPTATNQGIQSEMHFLPKSDTLSGKLKNLVAATLSGPLSLKYKRLAPADSRLLSVFTQEKRIWINLSREFQVDAEDCPLSPLERTALLSKTVKYNGINGFDLIILIDGKEIVDNRQLVPRKS